VHQVGKKKKTIMTKLLVVFRNYANVPKRYSPVGLPTRIRSLK